MWAWSGINTVLYILDLLNLLLRSCTLGRPRCCSRISWYSDSWCLIIILIKVFCLAEVKGIVIQAHTHSQRAWTVLSTTSGVRYSHCPCPWLFQQQRCCYIIHVLIQVNTLRMFQKMTNSITSITISGTCPISIAFLQFTVGKVYGTWNCFKLCKKPCISIIFRITWTAYVNWNTISWTLCVNFAQSRSSRRTKDTMTSRSKARIETLYRQTYSSQAYPDKKSNPHRVKYHST